ncbi:MULTISPECIES: O-antigen ligase family protein [Nostocales]|uniref:O-antigen ligase family protein n=2 Tax=Nostocales TaxID=1161 RepID=A0ABW8X0X1_9CYAN|nr:O-antigen ligase [Tolypothrix bouteillei]
MKKFLENAEIFFAILGLTFFSGVLGIGAMGDVLPSAVATSIRYIVWVASTLLIFIYWKKSLIAASRDVLLCLLTVLSLLSFAWSEFPDFTLSNAKEIFMMTSFGLYLATRFTLREQVQLIAFTLLLGAFFSIFFAIVFPSIAIHGFDHPGAWRGVYGYKNTLGSMMVLSSLAFFSLPKDSSILYKWFGFSLSIVLMLLSTSKTSLVLSFLLILVMLFYKNFRWQGKISVIFVDIGVLVLGCLSLVIFSYWVELISGLGKDPTLTGRTPLWATAISRLMERPFFGYGRDAYWAPKSKFAVEAGKAISGWIPPHAHNGFLDVALDIGLVGLSLFLVSFVIAFARALKRAYATKDTEELWPLAFLSFLAMNNMTESFLMRLANLYWVLYIAIAFTGHQKRLKRD